jgi:1-acyl-sn-glycerol-3-phosphate acyltransferase
VRKYLVFLFLAALRLVAKAFWRTRTRWIGEVPADPWRPFRIVCLLHHTSLFEWLWLAVVPLSFVWRVACHGVVPAAEKTISRPLVGWFFKAIAAHVVSITRERDHTWREVLGRIDPDSMVIILPEGRMMRANGLDSQGRPMTVRGGIADILDAIRDGPMLIAYSGGLHHVQAPGEGLPRLFRTLHMNFESLDIAAYRAERLAEGGTDAGFKRAVVDDLEARRDRNCPFEEGRSRPGRTRPDDAVGSSA